MSSYANKPITYPKNHRLLETDLYREVGEFIKGTDPKRPTAYRVLKDVFNAKLGARGSKAAVKKK